jgi:hypothetical protein
MRELYLIACGLVIGMSVRDWWDRQKRSIAWDAADHAEERQRERERFERNGIPPVEPTTPA